MVRPFSLLVFLRLLLILPFDDTAETPQTRMNFAQPLPILLQAFQPYSPELNEDYCFVRLSALRPFFQWSLTLSIPQRLVPYFKRVNIPRGTSLWTSGSEPDAFVFLFLCLSRH